MFLYPVNKSPIYYPLKAYILCDLYDIYHFMIAFQTILRSNGFLTSLDRNSTAPICFLSLRQEPQNLYTNPPLINNYIQTFSYTLSLIFITSFFNSLFNLKC